MDRYQSLEDKVKYIWFSYEINMQPIIKLQNQLVEQMISDTTFAYQISEDQIEQNRDMNSTIQDCKFLDQTFYYTF